MQNWDRDKLWIDKAKELTRIPIFWPNAWPSAQCILPTNAVPCVPHNCPLLGRRVIRPGSTEPSVVHG
ncbi:hypothetical protein VUR80DRAFT_664 [Thermomyces stellatus]